MTMQNIKDITHKISIDLLNKQLNQGQYSVEVERFAHMVLSGLSQDNATKNKNENKLKCVN